MQILIYPAAEAVPTLGLVTFGAEGISGVIADSARYRSTESLPPFFTARVSVDRMLLEGNIQVQVKNIIIALFDTPAAELALPACRYGKCAKTLSPVKRRVARIILAIEPCYIIEAGAHRTYNRVSPARTQ